MFLNKFIVWLSFFSEVMFVFILLVRQNRMLIVLERLIFIFEHTSYGYIYLIIKLSNNIKHENYALYYYTTVVHRVQHVCHKHINSNKADNILICVAWDRRRPVYVQVKVVSVNPSPQADFHFMCIVSHLK